MTQRANTDDEVREGARNAVLTCMKVKPQDRVFIMTDSGRKAIGRALLEESEKTGATGTLVVLEDYGRRPFVALPQKLVDDVTAFGPTVTFYAAGGQPGELKFRIPLREFLVYSLKVRHGHMIGITKPLMREGMRTDYNLIARITKTVFERVKEAKEIKFTSVKGSDFTAYLESPRLHWKACPGIYDKPGEWGNLPEGELFTSPENSNGLIVADVLGDYFSEKYGLLDSPVSFSIVDSRVVEVTCDNKALESELKDYLFGSENGNRVGEFAIGTNIGVTRLVGNLLQDEKFPGIHVAFGNPYPDETGANWHSDVHLDVVPVSCTITVDGEVIMKNGKFAEWIVE